MKTVFNEPIRAIWCPECDKVDKFANGNTLEIGALCKCGKQLMVTEAVPDTGEGE